jgi:dethiobiotin synthetase
VRIGEQRKTENGDENKDGDENEKENVGMSFAADNPKHRPPDGLPRIPGLLVASAAAGEGKTVVASAIAHNLRLEGRNVEVFLPVATGCRLARGGLVSDSADMLAAWAESRQTLAEISPVRLASPVAPAIASAIGGASVDIDAIFDAWRRLAGKAECVIVEAPGSIACPITEDFSTLNLAKCLALPVVLVVRAEPGALERALLAAKAARSGGLVLAGCVVNLYRADSASDEPLEDTLRGLPGLLERLAGLKTLALVPDDPANDVRAGRLAKSARFAIDQAQWGKIMG